MRVLSAQELNYVSAGSDSDDLIAEIFYEIFIEFCVEILVNFFIELTAAGIRKIHDWYYPPEVVHIHHRIA